VGDRPQVDSTAYIDPTAQVVGKVQIGAGVFVGPNAVIRADELGDSGGVESIVIGPECNVQDAVIIHSLGGKSVNVGARTSLAHGCVVHGPCNIGEGCFVGFRAVVFNAALGNGAFVGAGAIVQGVELPAGALVPPGTVVNSTEIVSGLPETGPKEREFIEEVVATNLKLARGYLALQRTQEPDAR
jgi:carbonic anhydrase/acetyltransferase-like protein (isoleucine patch superfamily)